MTDLPTLLRRHRSIRRYQPTPIEPSVIEEVCSDAIAGGSSSGNLNSISIVLTRDAERKRRLYELHAEQPMVLEAPLVMTFCADWHRTRTWLRQRGAAGFTLFRELNYESPAQIRELTAALQAAAAATAAEKTGIGLAGEQAGLLIAADQEGGQLIAMGAESSQFPGNMALGAAGAGAVPRRAYAAIDSAALAMDAYVFN